MRDRQQELTLQVPGALEVVGHLVDGPYQVGDLVRVLLLRGGEPHGEVPAGDSPGGSGDVDQGTAERAAQPDRRQDRQEDGSGGGEEEPTAFRADLHGGLDARDEGHCHVWLSPESTDRRGECDIAVAAAHRSVDQQRQWIDLLDLDAIREGGEHLRRDLVGRQRFEGGRPHLFGILPAHLATLDLGGEHPGCGVTGDLDVEHAELAYAQGAGHLPQPFLLPGVAEEVSGFAERPRGGLERSIGDGFRAAQGQLLGFLSGVAPGEQERAETCGDQAGDDDDEQGGQ